MASSTSMRTRLRTEALLVRSAPFSDADVVVTFFTEARGIISAVALSFIVHEPSEIIEWSRARSRFCRRLR